MIEINCKILKKIELTCQGNQGHRPWLLGLEICSFWTHLHEWKW